MTDPVTIAQILSIPFCIALVLMIVQLIKPLPFLQWIDTRVMVIVLSIVLTIVATILVGKTGLTDVFLALINSLVVATGAMGSYSVTFKASDDSKKLAAGYPPSVTDGKGPGV